MEINAYIIAVKDCYTKEILSIQVEKTLYQALANRNIKKLPVKELSVISNNGNKIIKATGALKKLGAWKNGEVLAKVG